MRSGFSGCLLSALALVAAAPAAYALTIDDFSVGPFNVTDDGTVEGPTLDEQTGLSPASVLGGTRLVSVTATGIVALPTTLPASAMTVDAAAQLTAGEVGVFIFTYDGIANLVGDGSAGALNLNISSFDGILVDAVVPVAGAVANLRLWDSDSSHAVTGLPLSTGLNQFNLADFTGVDLSDIQSLQLRVGGVGPTLSPTLTIQGIMTTPEPGTAVLLSLGLGVLAMHRRRSPARCM